MSIELTERTVGIWFMRVNEAVDFMAGLESMPDGEFKIDYRFRYYDPAVGDPFSPENKDEKHWYTVKAKRSRINMIRSVQLLVSRLEAKTGHQCTEILMKNGEVSQFMAELARQPWAHIRTGPA